MKAEMTTDNVIEKCRVLGVLDDGVASLGKRPETPGQEFLIAIAGPAVNVVLAFGLGALGVALFGAPALWEAASQARSEQPTLVTLFSMLVASNAVLAIFNMVPALPMDGGRVLRAVLSWFMGPEKATNVSAVVARLLAVGLVCVGLFVTPVNPMLVVIAMFVFVGAGQEVAEQRMSRVLDGVEIADVVSPYSPRFTPARRSAPPSLASTNRVHSSIRRTRCTATW